MNILVCVGFLFWFRCEAPPAPPPVVVCPPVTEWSQTYQRRLADEYEALAPGAAVRQAIREHIQIRKRAKVCRAR